MPFIRFIRLLKSFKYAVSGFFYALKEEQNFRVHFIASIAVIILMFVFKTSRIETYILIFAIALVLIAELINSIFERIVDILKPRLHPYAEKVKDMMAAVVLIAAIASLALGCLIFIPKILAILR